jgi:hypothetical protein
MSTPSDASTKMSRKNGYAASSQIRYASGSNDNRPRGRHSATVHEQEFFS